MHHQEQRHLIAIFVGEKNGLARILQDLEAAQYQQQQQQQKEEKKKKEEKNNMAAPVKNQFKAENRFNMTGKEPTVRLITAEFERRPPSSKTKKVAEFSSHA